VLLMGWAVVSERDSVGKALEQLTPGAIAAALGCVLVGLVANMLSWREVMRGLGAPLPVKAAARVFLLAQLGKYLPGSIWPLVAQAELAHDHGVSRTRSAVAGVVALVLGLAVGIIVAIVCLVPVEGTDSWLWPWALLLAVPMLVALHPKVLGRVVHAIMQRTKRRDEPVELSPGSMLRAAAWSAGMWFVLGLQIWLLVRDMDGEGDHLLLLSIGSYAAAWVGGFLVVIAPAGAGAREAALVVTLTPAVGRSGALALAVVSRALTLIGDGICALGAVLWGRKARAKPLVEGGEPAQVAH
jgi:glycosyltransferase 2 family protein